MLDIEGYERHTIDALGRKINVFDYNMVGIVFRQLSMEAGERWHLFDIVGQDLFSIDSRNQQIRTVYDPLRRVIECYLRGGTGREILVERTVYGETDTLSELRNSRGKIITLYDQAGVSITDQYDFKGNLLSSVQKLSKEFKLQLDWATNVPLEDTDHVTKTTYDALNRITTTTTPDNSITQNLYNELGQLNGVRVNLRGSTVFKPLIREVQYNAHRQHVLIKYGNGVNTIFDYDPLTFRMIKMLSQRKVGLFPGDCPSRPLRGWPGCHIQSLHYTYDPVGNITGIRDDAQQTIFFRNKRVDPSNDYTYDAIYRLIEATGREHLGQANGQAVEPIRDLDEVGRGNLPHGPYQLHTALFALEMKLNFSVGAMRIIQVGLATIRMANKVK